MKFMKLRQLMLLLSLLMLTLLSTVSCQKDKDDPIPPNPQPEVPSVIELEAQKTTEADFKKLLNKTVKLHGELSVKDGKSYFVLQDNFEIELYADPAVVNALSQEAKGKIHTNRQEVTATGTFVSVKESKVLARLVYKSEKDLVFGKPPIPSKGKIEAEKLTKALYETHKATGDRVELQGKVFIKEGIPHFKTAEADFLIKLKPTEGIVLNDDILQKFLTEGYEVIVSGKFIDQNQIVFERPNDLKFKEEPSSLPTPPVLSTETAKAADFTANEGKWITLGGKVSARGKIAYMTFDGVEVVLYSPYSDEMFHEVLYKLAVGETVSVTGKFETLPSGEKVLSYGAEKNVAFISVPYINAKTATHDTFMKYMNPDRNDKIFVILKGKAIAIMDTQQNHYRTHIFFGDRTDIELDVPEFHKLSKKSQEMLNDEGGIRFIGKGRFWGKRGGGQFVKWNKLSVYKGDDSLVLRPWIY